MEKTEQKRAANIRFGDSGKGDPIVLLHGFMESSSIWDELAAELVNHFRVITIDLPGHGNSDCIDTVHTMEMMATEVRNILEILGIEKCGIMGHSMGGYVAAAFAEMYPEFLKGLIFLNSHAFADSDETSKNRDRMIEAIENDHVLFIKNFIPDLFAKDNRKKFEKEIKALITIANGTDQSGIIAALRGMKIRKDRNDIILNLKVPVLYILGKQDSRTPLEAILSKVNQSQNAVSVVFEESGHISYIEAKEEMTEVVKDFFESL